MSDLVERLQNLIEADNDPAMVRFYKDCLAEIERLRVEIRELRGVVGPEGERAMLRAEIERLQERLKGSDMLAHVRGEQIERLQAELALYKQNYARKQLTDSERRALERKA